MMPTSPRKKLIEVSIPLEAINKASAREKSIRHGHPSTLHLWWARRPLAACRAVLFAQLVDDPSAWPEKFPTEAEQEKERLRLHRVIEDMVPWEASNNETILNAARWEIARSVAWGLGEEPPEKGDGKAILSYLQENAPPVYDPFSGGGSIPLEAQRLGLRAYGSDLNPVAVLIGKALVEIPPKFAGLPPVNPKSQAELKRGHWNGKGAQGLAEDVLYYGQWLRDEAKRRVGHLYPKAKSKDGSDAMVVAWLWARTVTCNNPACRHTTPLLSSFVLSSKKGADHYVTPVARNGTVTFEVSGRPPVGVAKPQEGLKRGMSGVFQCVHCGEVTSRDYVSQQGMAGALGTVNIATVVEGKRGRSYLGPDPSAHPALFPEIDISGIDIDLAPNPRDVWCRNFGITTADALFTRRQLTTLLTFSDLVSTARERVLADLSEAEKATDVLASDRHTAYADAVATYLGLGASKMADYSSTIVLWSASRDQAKSTFARQALPMAWDFAEVNPFAEAAGDFSVSISGIARTLSELPAIASGDIFNLDAQKNSFPVRPIVISTDPPYYDNIGYSDLSDFFYVWLRRSLSSVWPDLFRRLAAPKSEELVAIPYRHGSREQAESFFMRGMGEALTAMRKAATDSEPLAIYYAFKQSEAAEGGVTSAGWASFLQAVVEAGLAVDGTWPIRTERGARTVGIGTNALASSIVLVCRKLHSSAPTTDRAGFTSALRRDLPEAIANIRAAGVGPVDMQQSVIGPGMGVFTRYAEVLDDDDKALPVKAALAIINRVWQEIDSELVASFDAPTQVALAWFGSYGFDARSSGELITLANAKNTSIDALFASGVFQNLHGKAALTPRDQLPADWSPARDRNLTVWECAQHTARVLNSPEGGASAAGRLVAEMGPIATDARALIDHLFQTATAKGWAQEALAFNQLAEEWPHLLDRASSPEVAAATATTGDLFT